MNATNKLMPFNSGDFLVYDSENMPFKEYPHLSHFALTDALITYAGEQQQPILHFWQTSPLIILGMMDTKIGQFDRALNVFDQYEHEYVVRNSGGLGVVSDSGVLNVSLIYPSGEERLAIDTGYDLMLDFIRQTFYPYDAALEIEAYEIPNSYCFGDYDLSIEGRKIAGISQRRIQKGVAIMVYISVNGDQHQRAEIIKDFYEAGLDGSEPQGRYPAINPEVMATLEDAYDTRFTVAEVKKKMLNHFNWQAGEYFDEITSDYQEALEKMKRRNSRVFSEEYVENHMK